MTKKFSLGIDIDGVIANTQPLIISELNAYFDKTYTVNDFYHITPEKAYNIDRPQLYQFIAERELRLIKAAEPVQGSVEAIHKLKERCRITIISARTTDFYPNTVDWLRKHGIKHDRVILLGEHDKRKTCLEECVQLFIEDSLENAEQVSSCGIPVYLLNATYNRGKIPDLVRRVDSWSQIVNLLEEEFKAEQIFIE
ncbi:MAG: hypothetical protein FH756_07085 [Firmicutes bacterium]|nr:hypothetical protein [Bacillota bacterium]